MGAKKKSTTKVAQADDSDARYRRQETIGFGQFAGEGPLFYIRQFSGLIICAVGALFLVTSYTETWKILPFRESTSSYVGLAIMAVGAAVHEVRPFKVSTCPLRVLIKQCISQCIRCV